MEHESALTKGYKIQEYEIIRVLGAGGFGITYLSYDHNLDKPVAIKEYLPDELAVRKAGTKVIPKHSTASADYQYGLKQFLEEARTLARFKHPNLVQVHRFFEAHNTAYIVMEYAEGETLSAVLKRSGRLSEDALKAILFPILKGLAQMHAADFLHRDIKPGNIVICAEDNRPVLIDFGAARQAVGVKSKSVTSIVTPGYAPIEQYSTKGNLGPWTDIYALGAVSYLAITGKEPEPATDRVMQDELVSAVALGKGRAAVSFLAGIDRALSSAYEARPQTIDAWLALLNGEAEAPQTRHSLEGPAKGFPRKGTLLVVLLLALIGLGVWLQTQQQQQPKEQPKAQATAEPTAAAPKIAKTKQLPQGDESPASDPPSQEGLQQPEAPATAEPTAAAPKIAETEQLPQGDELQASDTPSQEGLQQQRITDLIAAAEADIKARRLLSPAGSNAYEKAQAVLKLAPNNTEATRLLDEILRVYQGLLQQALNNKALAEAEGYLARMKKVNQDALIVTESAVLIAEYKQGAEERKQQAEILRTYQGSLQQALNNKALAEAEGYLARMQKVNQDALIVTESAVLIAEYKRGAEERKKQLETRDEDGNTQLHRAARDGQTETALALIKAGADLEARDNDDDTPLHRAAWEGHTETALALIEAGADINARSKRDKTPLHRAAINGHTETALAMIEAGADVNARDKDGDTPLHYAAGQGQTETALALIGAGADINARDKVDNTPLHLAAYWGQTETALALIEAGADVNARGGERDETPAERARWRDHPATARAIDAAR